MSVTNNKDLIPLLNVLINCISAKSPPQILSSNDEYTFQIFLQLVYEIHLQVVDFV